MAEAPVLILPGLFNSGPEHWQSRWEAAHPALRRVQQDDWERPRCSDWVARLEAATRSLPGAVLVGHSSACALVAHWAAAHPTGRVKAALLVGPSDPEGPNYPEGPTGFAPMPLDPLRFPTIVVASRNDRYVTWERARQFAQAWGSRLVNVGEAGHINSESGLGEWPFGFGLLQDLRQG